MLNALRLNNEAFPLSFAEWSILQRESLIWNERTGNWDSSVLVAASGNVTQYKPPTVAVIRRGSGSRPSILMERQRSEAVLCSVHALNNLMQQRLANPAMFQNMENAFNADGSLQQCDSEHVTRVARVLGIALVGVTIAAQAIGGEQPVNDLQKLQRNEMLERFLQSSGGFIALRLGKISRESRIGSGHYVAVLYGGQRYGGRWILMNSLSTDVRLYESAYAALYDFQKGQLGNVSIYFPAIPRLQTDGSVDHDAQATALSEAHFRCLRLNILMEQDFSVDAWLALLQRDVTTLQLNSAFTYTVFNSKRKIDILASQSPDGWNLESDVNDMRIGWLSNYSEAVLGVLGANSLFNFRFFMWTLLVANASTSESVAAYRTLANSLKPRRKLFSILHHLYSLAHQLFKSLNAAGNLSLMTKSLSVDQLSAALLISLEPLLLDILPQFQSVTSKAVVQELVKLLSRDSFSVFYRNFIVSFGNSLSNFIPEWLVQRQHYVYGFERQLYRPDVFVSVEDSDSIDAVSDSVRDRYYERALKNTALRAAIRLLMLRLIERQDAAANTAAERNALVRTGLPPNLIQPQSVPVATAFSKLLRQSGPSLVEH